MKLLLDENLSHRLVRTLIDLHPGSTHVREVGLERASDADVWAYAANHGYAIVSKDSDFPERSLLERPPPKVVWIPKNPALASSRLRTRPPRVRDLVRTDPC